jgi:NSS family neurotransmitter:Na+ symporter
MPLVICEFVIGRRGGLNAVGSMRAVAKAEGASKKWAFVGWLGMATGLVILSYYSVIAGWIIAYLPKLAFVSADLIGDRATHSGLVFGELLQDWKAQAIGHSIFMLLTIAIVWRGLNKGIEVAINILMPAFFIMLFLLALYALVVGDALAGLTFLFRPDFSLITPDVMINALGHSFFSIGVGSAIMITYGSYLKKDVKIGQSALIISLADTTIAITAGILIFPLVFQYGLEPNAGPGLLFVTLPVAFAQMPFGNIIGVTFFVLALVAALTSAISMLEIFVRWATDRSSWSRHTATLAGGLGVWAFGFFTVLSPTTLSNVKILNRTPFDLFNFLTGSVMLPISGLLVAVFVGWFISKKSLRDELDLSATHFFLWRTVVKFIVPVAVFGILLLKLGVIG